MMKGWLLGTAIVFVTASALWAADPPGTTDAEIRLLRATIDRQKQEIEELNKQIAELTGQLKALGMGKSEGHSAAATKPHKPKRVVFVIDHYWAFTTRDSLFEEVSKAVHELEPDQWFNIVYRPYPHGEPIALQATMLPVSDRSREQVRKFFQGRLSPSPDGFPALALAIKWKPDVIWYCSGGTENAPKFLADVRKLNANARVRINTTVKFLPRETTLRRFMWELANDAGGVCLDHDGQPMPEPPISIKVELPKPSPPATKPSVLKAP